MHWLARFDAVSGYRSPLTAPGFLMLRSLSIRDFAIVDQLELEFSPGFTVLTGETGAGKSILIDALAMVLGERADAIVVRSGAERAEIEAEFGVDERPDVTHWLRDNELAGDEGMLLMRRVVESSGRSRGFINGRAATLVQLRQMGERLVDIHGQHEHQSLGRASAQRELLDDFGGLADACGKVAQLHGAWRERHESRVAFETNAAAFAAEREQLEWQVRELEALRFGAGEWPELVAEHSRLAHAAALIEAAQLGVEALFEGDDSILARVNAVAVRLGNLVEHDAGLQEILDLLEPARIQLQEAVYALRHYGERLDLDPQRLREVEGRLDAIHAAARKYRTQPDALPARLEAARTRLRGLGEGGDVGALRRLEEAAHAACLAEAGKLSAGRKKRSEERRVGKECRSRWSPYH